MSIDREERYSRQSELVPSDRLADITATVIGTGAIGRQVALQLAAMGVPKLVLIDFDNVEDGNLAAQGFMEKDLGKSKVEAVAALCHEINSEIEIEIHVNRFRRSDNITGVVFCCVDSIDTRSFIWEALQNKQVTLFVDGRMAAEAIRVISAFDDNSKQYYQTTLFPGAEAHTGSCTAKTTIYSSNVAAGIMVSQMAKWLREMPVAQDVQFNLLTMEIDAVDGTISTEE